MSKFTTKTILIIFFLSFFGFAKISFADNLDVNADSILTDHVNIIGSVNIAENITFGSAAYDISASKIAINEGAIFNVGSGAINASIRGASDNVGVVNFTSDNSFSASVGTGTTTLAEINIKNGATINASDKSINSNIINIHSGSTFNYGSGSVVGNFQGANDGEGVFSFTQTKTTNFSIGDVRKLAQINISDSKTATLGGDIAATTINIGQSSGGKISSKGYEISSDNINLASGATLNIDINSNISGEINGAVANAGIVQFSGNGAKIQDYSLGAINALEQIVVDENVEMTINNNITFNAHIIDIGDDDTSNAALTQNNGIIGIDGNSQIRLDANNILNYHGGTINGTVRGKSSGKGIFNINENYQNDAEIGQSYSLKQLNIATNKTLTANADINADDINIAGTLNLGNSARQIGGNITTNGGAANINLGQAFHNLSGNFSAISGDSVTSNIVDKNTFGSLNSAAAAQIADGLKLNINFNINDGYLSDGDELAIISADSNSQIDIVDEADIDVNSSGSNALGLISFSSKVLDGDLILVVNREKPKNFTDNKISQDFYGILDEAGSGASGALRNLQKKMDDSATSHGQRKKILKELIPQDNKDLHQGTIDVVFAANKIIKSRLGKAFSNPQGNYIKTFNASSAIAAPSLSFANAGQIKNHQDDFNKISFMDEPIFDSQSLWLQAFTNSAEQKDFGDTDGYQSSSYGLLVGADQLVAENIIFGVAAGISTSEIESNSANDKNLDINSYQFNIYGAYNLAPFFFNSTLGVAINEYESQRKMDEMGLVANAKYGGKTYFGQFEAGFKKDFDTFSILPHIGLDFSRNYVDSYSESGADSLNLRVSNEQYDLAQAVSGFTFRYENLAIDDLKFYPKISAAIKYDILGSSHSSSVGFVGQEASFNIDSAANSRYAFEYGAAIDIYAQDGILLSLEYEEEVKSKYKSKTGLFYLRYNF